MSRKKSIPFTKARKDFVCDKVAEGMTVSAICKKYESNLPSAATVCRCKDAQFQEDLDAAYFAHFQVLHDQLRQITEELDANGENYTSQKINSLRVVLQSKQFELAKLAPVMSNRYQARQKVQHSVDSGAANVVVIDYNAPKEDDKK